MRKSRGIHFLKIAGLYGIFSKVAKTGTKNAPNPRVTIIHVMNTEDYTKIRRGLMKILITEQVIIHSIKLLRFA